MKLVPAIVECPKGSNYKFDYIPATNQFKLSKILPAGLIWPFDFGFIPGTKGEDGDPLDIIVVSEIIGFPGCLIDCRIIGGFKALQTELDGTVMRNDRFVGIAQVSQLFAGINDLAYLPESIIDQLEAFFKNYNLQAGKQFEVIERLYASDAARCYLRN